MSRGGVRLGSDSTIAEVDTTTIPTTIEDLSYYEYSTQPAADTRNGTFERATFILDGSLVSYQLTDDSDYELVIRSASGSTLKARVPHPSCVASSSPLFDAIVSARAAIDNSVVTTRSVKSAATSVRIAGIGFYPMIDSTTRLPASVELGPLVTFAVNPTGSLPLNPELTVVEYYSLGTDSYFLTGRPREMALLDGLPSAFRRTGMTMKAKSGVGTPRANAAICRYYFKEGTLNSTHFYGAGNDCSMLKGVAATNAAFNDEGYDFLVGSIVTAASPQCTPSAPVLVSRSFRPQGSGKTVNHRYTVSAATYAATAAAGYINEGGTYCVANATDVR